MSRSKRKPIIKDKPRNRKASTYYRKVRRVVKLAVKAFKEVIPESQEIQNDYDYCDYVFDMTHSQDEIQKAKYSRK